MIFFNSNINICMIESDFEDCSLIGTNCALLVNLAELIIQLYYTYYKLFRNQLARICEKMSAIPQGAFMARKIRCSLQRAPPSRGDSNSGRHRGTWRLELSPLKYNSKLMNSIWGLYNRYSVHNFKKNTDANFGLFTGLVHVVEQHRYLAYAVSTSGSVLVSKALWASVGALGLI